VLTSLDVIVDDVRSAAALLRDAFGFEVNVLDDRFAELRADPLILMLSPDAMVPMETARGVILHLRVDDPRARAARAVAAGATVLQEFTVTDWLTESVLLAGPAELVIDFYRDAPPAPGEAQ
jgi:uncharacterized glyoxalase superfamily protein PhnB